MSPTLLDKIRNCTELPSLPAIAVQVLEMTQEDQADLNKIAEVISRDPALSGKILRVVNSSFYGRSKPVGTISQAMVVLGLHSVKTLVLGFTLINNLQGGGKAAKGFRHVQYWKHSLFTATAARMFAQKVGIRDVEEVFLIGLLADIGMLVMDRVIGDAYGGSLASLTSHDGLCTLERQAFDTTHAELSGLLAGQWKLPPLLAMPIANHHTPEKVEDPTLRKMAEVVAAASRCADVFVDTDAAPAITDLRKRYFKAFDLSDADGDALLAQIQSKTKEAAALFEINIGESEPYERVLQRANEQLVKLMLEQQAQADTLRQQNQSLRVQATTDKLTGLANRAAFDEMSCAFWETAVAGGKPLSLIMVDLDRFKKINDTFGHPAGDEVLRTIGRMFKAAARAGDVAARFGGEEMVLLLPDTPRATAAVIAENLRSTIRARPVVCENVPISVTASLGLATAEPGSPLKSLAHLLKAADLALYQAKHAGRDRVKVFQPIAAKAA